jgi:hypothetical protein
LISERVFSFNTSPEPVFNFRSIEIWSERKSAFAAKSSIQAHLNYPDFGIDIQIVH